MTQIIVKQTQGQHTVEVDVTDAGCVVHTHLISTIEVPWDKVTDIVYLADTFSNIHVGEFALLIPMLEKIYANKELYISLK